MSIAAVGPMQKGDLGVRAPLKDRYGRLLATRVLATRVLATRVLATRALATRVLATLALLVTFVLSATAAPGAPPAARSAVCDRHHAALAVPDCRPHAAAAGSGHGVALAGNGQPAQPHTPSCCGSAGCLQPVPALPAVVALPVPPPRATAFAIAVTPIPPGVGGHPAVPPPRLLA